MSNKSVRLSKSDFLIKQNEISENQNFAQK